MESRADEYQDFAHHPRYGRRPIITGLNPHPLQAGVDLHWNTYTPQEIVARYESACGQKWPLGELPASTSGSQRVPQTAVLANTAKQLGATVSVTHYFDLERCCRDCTRPFIFFAEEQKYWYEVLGFGLDSDCVRCVDCRKRQRRIANLRAIYESLYHVQPRTAEQTLEFARCCIALVESGDFTPKKREFARMLLKSIPTDSDLRQQGLHADLWQRSRSWPALPTGSRVG